MIASGIILAAALLIVTGLVAGHLRQQTLAASEAGLSRLDAVLVETGNRSLLGAEAVLSDIASHIRLADAPRPDSIGRDIGEVAVATHLDRRVEAAPQIAGLALVGADGAVVSHAGGWPADDANISQRDYFLQLQQNSELESSIGAPIPLEPGGAQVIPVAHKLRTADGRFAGLAVATVPVSDFENLYRAIPLGSGSTISLLRRDGTVLAQFPREPGGASHPPSARVLGLIADGAPGVFTDSDAGGQWSIDALQPLSDYPVTIVVSANGAQALVAWSRQADMFGLFAIIGVLAIGLMGGLIGRQIHTYNALAAMRAEKIEAEHAKLLAEAELLKKERLSVLGQFTATVANELRNPLAAIRNTLFTMREIATTSGLTLDRPIARIQRSIARCDRIIGNLLEYVRTPDLTRVPVNFDDWLRDILAEHGLPPTATLIEDYGAPGSIVRIDSDRLRHVVLNLVDNAAQALGEMPTSDRSLRISMSSRVAAGALEVIVADNGPGIPPGVLPRIFEPLFSTKSFGTGLGLPIVKQIVVQHGGTIAIESEMGTGTTVTIRLPIEQVPRMAA